MLSSAGSFSGAPYTSQEKGVAEIGGRLPVRRGKNPWVYRIVGEIKRRPRPATAFLFVIRQFQQERIIVVIPNLIRSMPEGDKLFIRTVSLPPTGGREKSKVLLFLEGADLKFYQDFSTECDGEVTDSSSLHPFVSLGIPIVSKALLSIYWM